MNGRRTLAALCLGLLLMITFVGQAVGTTSAALPSFNAGDLAVVFAFRDGSTTAPSIPAGWTNITTRGTTTSCSQRLGYRILKTGDTTTGTWTNATHVGVIVYRSSTGMVFPGGFATNGGTTNTANFPAVTFLRGDGTSWAAGFIGHRSTDQNVATPPSGMTNRYHDDAGATDDAAGHDTNGGVSTWGSTNETLTGTASGWQSAVLEIIEAQFGDETQAVFTDNGATPSAVALPAGVRVGQLLVVYCGHAGNTDPTVTDDSSNGWHQVSRNYNAGQDYSTTILWALHAGAEGAIVTITVAGGTGSREAARLAYFGPFDASPQDTNGTGQGSSASAATSSFTPSVNGALIFGGSMALAALTKGGGFTEDTNNSGTSAFVLTEHLVQVTAASIQVTATLTSNAWNIGGVAFKPAGGGGDVLFAQAIF